MRTVFGVLAALTASARAQPAASPVAAPPAADAAVTPAMALFREGLALLDNHDAAGACAKFEESLKLEPDAAGPMLNLGLCNEQLDHLATALRWFRRVQTRAAELQLPDAETAAKEKTTALVQRVPTIAITFTRPQPYGSAVAVDGRLVEDIDVKRVELDAGHHVVELVGFDSARQDIDIADGDTRSVQLVVPAPPPPPAPPKHYVTVDRGGDARRNAYIIGGAGLVVWAGDAVLLSIAKSSYDGTERPDTREKWRNVGRYAGTSLFVVGAGALAAATWMYFRAPGKERVEQTVIAPVVTRDRVGLAFERSF